VLICCG